jgi:lipid-binding SYLF domain-containing protein
MARAGAVALALCIPALLAPARAASENLGERVYRAEEVWREFTDSKRTPPRRIIDNSRCIAVIPRVIKGAFGVGGHHGRGLVSCRRPAGDWSPPVFVKLSGGSVGLQIGGEATDFILFIVSESGAKALLRSGFTLGADASVAAGSFGSSVESKTDIRLKAEIYTYARSKGFFAGASLEGGKLTIETKSIRRYYGRWIHPEVLLFEDEEVALPPGAQKLLALLPARHAEESR